MHEKITIFCDIDGTLVHHYPPSVTTTPYHIPTILDGTLNKLSEWEKLGYIIILVTARKECMRVVTLKQLSKLGIFYDQLIMGISNGKRILINDINISGIEAAKSINLERNIGIKSINL